MGILKKCVLSDFLFTYHWLGIVLSTGTYLIITCKSTGIKGLPCIWIDKKKVKSNKQTWRKLMAQTTWIRWQGCPNCSPSPPKWSASYSGTDPRETLPSFVPGLSVCRCCQALRESTTEKNNYFDTEMKFKKLGVGLLRFRFFGYFKVSDMYILVDS